MLYMQGTTDTQVCSLLHPNAMHAGNNGHTGTLPTPSQCYTCGEQRTHRYAPYSIPMLYMRRITDTQVRSLLHPNAIHAGNNGHTGLLPTPSQCYTCGEQRTHRYAPYSVPMLYMRGTKDTQIRSLLYPNVIHAEINGHTGTLPTPPKCYTRGEQRTHRYAPYSIPMLYMRGTTDTRYAFYSIPMLYMRGTTDTQVRSLLHRNAIHAGNNGHTVQVDLNDQSMMISEGGLEGTYVAAQLHFHWGADNTRGSEHAINGRHYPMEMHIVHYNRKYGNFTAALKREDGLAVLGFFFEHVPIESIPLIELIPARLSNYFQYLGSLTTPPCYESLEKFRTTIFENIEDEGGVSMDISDDFRPVQCLYRRRVHASHQSLRYDTGPTAAAFQDDDPSAANVVTSVASIVLFIMALMNIGL
ncbi:CAH2-like protein [Mya arenaria]|uniref:Carbonic anhydrase n=1 Tax=Mya arenaria TaxID=6604 RepID=A0ABY7F299_MYAAR|nr:CAH2-like protein [Mya arenaria]